MQVLMLALALAQACDSISMFLWTANITPYKFLSVEEIKIKIGLSVHKAVALENRDIYKSTFNYVLGYLAIYLNSMFHVF